MALPLAGREEANGLALAAVAREARRAGWGGLGAVELALQVLCVCGHKGGHAHEPVGREGAAKAHTEVATAVPADPSVPHQQKHWVHRSACWTGQKL